MRLRPAGWLLAGGALTAVAVITLVSTGGGATNGPGTVTVRQPGGHRIGDVTAKSVALFVIAAVAEIGGAWLVWQGWREHRGLWWIAGGVFALGAYGFVATFQPDPHFGRILAAYGGVFVAGSLAWGMLLDGFRPDRYDVAGAVVCLLGVGLIMYGPRG